jgi:hypothetical protein
MQSFFRTSPLALSSLSLLAALCTGCDSSDSTDSTDPLEVADGSVEDANDGESMLSKEPLEPESEACEEVLQGTFPDSEESDCWSQQPSVGDDHCMGFFCNWTIQQIECQTTKRVCEKFAARLLGCDNTVQDVASSCARSVQTSLLLGGNASDFYPMTRACTAEGIGEDIGDDCLDCYIASSECARDNCVIECLSGDSPACDVCREDAGCTPQFHECSGIPNPQHFLPDGSEK